MNLLTNRVADVSPGPAPNSTLSTGPFGKQRTARPELNSQVGFASWLFLDWLVYFQQGLFTDRKPSECPSSQNALLGVSLHLYGMQ